MPLVDGDIGRVLEIPDHVLIEKRIAVEIWPPATLKFPVTSMTMVVADVSFVNVMEALGVASCAPEISNTATPSTGVTLKVTALFAIVN